MNKKLIALAIAGAFAAPLAMADNGNVVIYGDMAVSADMVDGGSYNSVSTGPHTGPINALSTNSAQRRGRISSNNSFIGFKGSEDLGNGMNAIWQFENGIALDGQNTNDNGPQAVGGTGLYPSTFGSQSRRNTFAGLSSKDLGSVTFGVQDSPVKTATGPMDAFGQHTLADYRSLWGTINGATPASSASMNGANIANLRAQNSVLYTSPNMGGFTIKAMGAAQNEGGNFNGTGSGATGHYYSVGGIYANGPLFATLAYEDNRVTNNNNNPTGTPPSNFSDFNFKNWRTGVGYNFSGLKIGLAYERIKGDGTVLAGSTSSVNRDAWYVPVSYQMGSNTFKLAYTKAGKSNQKSSTGADLSGSDGASQWSLGVNHAMSKRTSVYALYSMVRNDSNGFYSLGGAGTGIQAVAPGSYGSSPRAVSVGMITSF